MTPEDLKAARDYVRAKAWHACGGLKGRGKLDPVYVEVTQGRDSKGNWAHYSSCGDQLHWMAWELGVRSSWVNRDDIPSGRHWIPGVNITALEKPAIYTPASWLPAPGDFLLMWDTGTDAHVAIAGTTDSGVLETFNYGAGGMSPTEFPGANVAHVTIIHTGTNLAIQNIKTKHTKTIRMVLSLDKLLSESGELPSMTGEEIDALLKDVP